MLSLIKNNLGEYVAEEATKVANIPVDTSAYDAYSGTQKTSLATGTGAGSTDLGKQTEAIIQREDPSKQSLVFDAKTGTFKTQGDIKQDKQKVEFGKLPTTSDTTATGKTTDPLSVAQRIARMTPMANQSMGQLPDFESMMESMQPSIKDQVFSTALSAGKDIAIKYATQKVLGTHPFERFYDGVSMPECIGGLGRPPYDPIVGSYQRMPKALYITPVGQNPTGYTMPPHRYAQIYQICRDYGIMIIEARNKLFSLFFESYYNKHKSFFWIV